MLTRKQAVALTSRVTGTQKRTLKQSVFLDLQNEKQASFTALRGTARYKPPNDAKMEHVFEWRRFGICATSSLDATYSESAYKFLDES